MIAIELELIEPLGRMSARPWADHVTGMQIDSRRVEEGDLFVAAGESGADFAAHAFARGAAAVLVPEQPELALAAVAAAVRERSHARFVAITGATGKTTTKDILAVLCAPHLRTVASEGNFNNELGVPLTVGRVEPDTELCILEMGMRGLGQIEWLASFSRPEVGLITNIAPVHLELVQTIENVARAKAELIAALPPGGTAVVPDGESLLDPYLTRTDITIRRFGHVLEYGRFEVGEQTVELETSFRSSHQLDNTLAALTVCDVLGIPLAEGRLEVEFSPLREQVLELADGITAIVDCYNANPISMRAALEHLAQLAGGRRQVAVLGEMAELGPRAAELHREVAAELTRTGVSALVAVGALARAYAGSGVETVQVENAAQAAAATLELLRPGDVVLIKGSRSVGLEAVAAKLRS